MLCGAVERFQTLQLESCPAVVIPSSFTHFLDRAEAASSAHFSTLPADCNRIGREHSIDRSGKGQGDSWDKAGKRRSFVRSLRRP